MLTSTDIRPLILDRVLAAVLRRLASELGRNSGYAWAGETASRIWRSGAWTSHRYSVYLRWMHAANARLTALSPGWPDNPDVLELALFKGAWKPA